MHVLGLTFIIGSLVLALNIGVSAKVPAGFQTPWFCHDLECPVYRLVARNDNFETRHYDASQWVATRLTTANYTDAATRVMFFKLFHYISGNNTLNKKMAMTAPVLKQVDSCHGDNCQSNYTEHFMMPFDLQANPPTPTEAGVFIRKLQPITVYVRSYGGYSTPAIINKQHAMLVQDLQAANKLFNQDHYYTAGYDGPYSFVRHNEIWIAAM